VTQGSAQSCRSTSGLISDDVAQYRNRGRSWNCPADDGKPSIGGSLIVVGVSLNVRSFRHQSWSRTLSTFTSKTELGGLLDNGRDYWWRNIGGLAQRSRCAYATSKLMCTNRQNAWQALGGGILGPRSAMQVLRRLEAGINSHQPAVRFVTFWLPVVSDLVSSPIWSYRLRHATHWARGGVANADAPLADEHATAFAFGGHIYALSACENSTSLDSAPAQAFLHGRACVGRVSMADRLRRP
jgi:hypothetical protein